jgi:hypothetical protein
MQNPRILVVAILAVCSLALFANDGNASSTASPSASDQANLKSALNMLDQGRQVFRFATFDDQTFWGDALRLHEAIAGAKFGGVGPGLSPKAALALGLKVDVDALPAALVEQLHREK